MSLEKPVFIFSASWRTGSTLLQRVLNTDAELLVWGEPNFLWGFGQAYFQGKEHFEASLWQRKEIKNKGLANAWSPVLSPKPEMMTKAARSFMDVMYSSELAELGKLRWGFKEVRANAYRNARMMRELYPQAKIIFHYRDPFETFGSVRKADFYESFKWPYQPVRIWAENVKDFIEAKDANELNAFYITHEELTGNDQNRVVKSLFDYVEIPFNSELTIKPISNKVGGSLGKTPLEPEVKQRIEEILVEVMGLGFAKGFIQKPFV